MLCLNFLRIPQTKKTIVKVNSDKQSSLLFLHLIKWFYSVYIDAK